MSNLISDRSALRESNPPEAVSNHDAAAPALTQQKTAENSMMDHSSQVTDDTPDTNMEDLFDSKDRDEESTTGATVSCYTACDGSEENDLPVFKETTIYRRRFKARFEDGRAEEGSLSNTERDDEDDYRNYEASRRRTANTSSLYESYVERLSDDTDGQKNQDLKLVRTAINYVRVLEEERSPIFAVLERDLPYGSQKRDNGPQIKWADVGLEVKFFNAETELNLDGTLVAENMTKEGTYTSLRGPKTLIRVLYDRTEEHAREPPHITDGEQPDPEQVVLLAMGLTSEPIAKFFKKKLDLETDNTFLVRFSKPFRPLLRSLQPLREQLAKLEEKFKACKVEQPDFQSDEPGTTVTASDLHVEPSLRNEDGSIEDFDREEAVEHFRILLQFVDKYLGVQASLLEKLQAGKEDNIAFENLWMLFNSGDTIYAPFNRGGQILRNDEDEKHTTKRRDVPQAYRVLSTVGGVPKAFARKLKQNSKNSPSIVVNEQGISDSGRLKNRYVPLYVYCLYVDFDSSRYDAVAEIFVFKPYEGKIDVRDLEAYPLHYLDARPNEFKIDSGFFLDRGRKFIDMTAVSHMTYEGLTIGENQEDINSAVIVDFRLAVQEFKPALKEFESIFPTFSHGLTNFWYNIKSNHLTEFVGSPCSAQWCYSCEHMNDRYVEQQKKQREKIEAKIKALLEEYGLENSDQVEGIERFKQYMEDHDLIRLLPGVVPGFALRNRRWIQADLRLLQNVKKEYGWNDLVLPKGHREMVQAMVETHAQRSRSTTGQLQDKIAMDLVGGRGNGCIILLHGAPGVGKTSTAECVAAYTKRPLYTITCGDIGYSPDAVEKDMQKHFKLAHKWGCVLLLDEADVFLAKRSKDDVKRNGLVSVFLRILEYYSGMMFLTTNRVGAIDDAFRSRLHLTLYYPKLDKKQTIKIWKTNLGRMYAINEERVQNGRLPIEFKADRIIKWVKKNWMVVHWNGRQIRNAFQTAIALGEFRASASSPTQAPVMDVKQFKTIATSSVQFNQYLLETHGADEDKTAKRDMIRTELDPAKMNLKQFVTSGDSFDSTEDSSAESDDYLEEDLDDSERDERKNFKARKKPNADRRATRRSQKTRRRSSPDQ